MNFKERLKDYYLKDTRVSVLTHSVCVTSLVGSFYLFLVFYFDLFPWFSPMRFFIVVLIPNVIYGYVREEILINLNDYSFDYLNSAISIAVPTFIFLVMFIFR